MIAKQVKKGVKKQLAAADKKQKSDDDSDSDEDCAPLQGLTGALHGFNYEQMENLSIDDDEVPAKKPARTCSALVQRN